MSVQSKAATWSEALDRAKKNVNDCQEALSKLVETRPEYVSADPYDHMGTRRAHAEVTQEGHLGLYGGYIHRDDVRSFANWLLETYG